MSHLNPPPPDHPSHTAQALCASVPLCRAVPRPSSLDSRGQDVRGWISTRQDATPLVLTPVVSPTRTTSHTARVDGEATCADSVTRGGTRHRGTERFPRDPVPMNAWFILSNRVLGGRRPDGGWVICARPAAPSPRRHGGTEGHGEGKPRGGPASASVWVLMPSDATSRRAFLLSVGAPQVPRQRPATRVRTPSRHYTGGTCDLEDPVRVGRAQGQGGPRARGSELEGRGLAAQ